MAFVDACVNAGGCYHMLLPVIWGPPPVRVRIPDVAMLGAIGFSAHAGLVSSIYKGVATLHA